MALAPVEELFRINPKNFLTPGQTRLRASKSQTDIGRFQKVGVLLVGVLEIGALLFGVSARAPDFGSSHVWPREPPLYASGATQDAGEITIDELTDIRNYTAFLESGRPLFLVGACFLGFHRFSLGCRGFASRCTCEDFQKFRGGWDVELVRLEVRAWDLQ